MARSSHSKEVSDQKSDTPPQKGTTLGAIVSFLVLVVVVFGFKHSVLDANNIPSGSMIPTLKVGDYLFVNRMRYSLRLPFTNLELLRIDDPKRGEIVTFIPPNDEEKQYVKRVIAIPGDRIRIRNISVCDDSLTIDRSKEADFDCDVISFRKIPVLAIVEYKPKLSTDEDRDASAWQTYPLREMSGLETRNELTDSDDAEVLHPDYFENPTVAELPVLFTEQTGSHRHYIVEWSDMPRPDGLCPTIETTGCVVPDDHYFVMGDNRDDSKDSRFSPVGFINRNRILGKPLVIYFSIDWRDQICASYIRNFSGYSFDDPSSNESRGFPIEDFGPEKQQKYCTGNDVNAVLGGESVSEYLVRTAFYRIPRMSVRWKRIGTLLE